MSGSISKMEEEITMESSKRLNDPRVHEDAVFEKTPDGTGYIVKGFKRQVLIQRLNSRIRNRNELYRLMFGPEFKYDPRLAIDLKNRVESIGDKGTFVDHLVELNERDEEMVEALRNGGVEIHISKELYDEFYVLNLEISEYLNKKYDRAV